MICSRVKDTQIIIHLWIGIGIGLRVDQSQRLREIWDMGTKKVITVDVVKILHFSRWKIENMLCICYLRPLNLP